MNDWPQEERRDEHGTPYWGRVRDGKWETNPDIVAMFQSVNRAFGEVRRVWAQQWQELVQSPAGQQLAALGRYYDEHPEELERLREANRPRRVCDCVCGRWGHKGVCTVDATTAVPITSAITGLVQVPMCEPCAADVRASAVKA